MKRGKEKVLLKCMILLITACLFSCLDKEDPVMLAKKTNRVNLDKNTEGDARVLVDIYSDNLYNIRISEGAESLSTSLEIQKLGTELVNSYSLLNKRIRQIAVERNIRLPEELTEKQIKDSQSLLEKVGYDFNIAYTKEISGKYKNILKSYEKIINESADPDIKELVKVSLPEVHKHWLMTVTSYENVKMPN